MQYGPRRRELPVTPVTPVTSVTPVTPVTSFIPVGPASCSAEQRPCGEDRVVGFSARRKHTAGAARLGNGYGPHVCA